MGIRAVLGHPTIGDIANQLQRDGVKSVEISLRAGHIPNGGAVDGTRAVLRAFLSTEGGFHRQIGQVDYPYWLQAPGVTGVGQRNRLTDQVLKKAEVLEAKGIAVSIDGKPSAEVKKELRDFGYSTNAELQRGRR